jgi:EAL domain-containing protein (putative c-di-GMP-specific phosphodiesterase class I)
MLIELSQLLGRLAVTKGRRLPSGTKIFVNVHARELATPGFLSWLSALHSSSDHPIVIEITESSITDVTMMADYKKTFTKLGLEFAYDDFGAGQGRLVELTDVPPDYLKFDRSLMDGIEAATGRQEVVKALVTIARTLSVKVIAEGIETEQVADVCRQLGCQLGQGYLFGRPTLTTTRTMSWPG